MINSKEKTYTSENGVKASMRKKSMKTKQKNKKKRMKEGKWMEEQEKMILSKAMGRRKRTERGWDGLKEEETDKKK